MGNEVEVWYFAKNKTFRKKGYKKGSISIFVKHGQVF